MAINHLLKKQIILHILNRFGIFTTNKYSSLNIDNFILSEKLKLNTENGVIENKLWAGETNVDSSKIQFIIADISNDIIEFLLIIQLDLFPPYIIRMSVDDDDAGSMYIKVKSSNNDQDLLMTENQDRWIEASTIIQSRALSAIEDMFELPVVWKTSKNIAYMYNLVLDYLKFEEESLND